MNSLWFLWDILINILQIIFLCFLLKKKLGYPQRKKKWVFAGAAAIIVALTAMNYYCVNYSVVTISIYCLQILFALFLFEGTPAMRVMWSSAVSVIYVLASSIVSFIANYLDFINIQIALTPSFARIVPTTIFILICFALIALLMKFPNMKIALPRSLQTCIILVSIICSVLVGQLEGLALSPSFSDAERRLYLIASFALIIFLLGFFFVMHKTGEFFQSDAEHQNQIRSMVLENKNNEKMQSVISAWNHDQHHHITVLSAYAVNNDIAQIKEYLKEMQADLEINTTMINTGNAVLDALLSNNFNVCKSEHIRFKIAAKDIGKLPISDTELSSLVGNMLDNAVDACKQCVDRESFIDFNIYRRQKMIVISTINSSAGNYNFNDNVLASTKAVKGHGYGLKRIKQITENANGFMHIDPMNEIFKIEVCIPDVNMNG